MNILTGIQNFLQFINDNWTTIFVIIGLLITIVEKTISTFKKSKDEKIQIAKKQIEQIVLKMVSDAENDYKEWNKSGSIKRSQVISEIYKLYPILSKVTSQNELTEWLDSIIDQSLDKVKNTLNKLNDTKSYK